MNKVEALLLRSTFADDFTLGTLFFAGKFLGFTCEDKDRHLEAGGVKVLKETAIPRGYYRLTVSMSRRFGKLMPEIKDVPQFSGVRIHGGNFAGKKSYYLTIKKPDGKPVLEMDECIEVVE